MTFLCPGWRIKNVIRKTITFFACCELQYETLSGAYTPFLDIICDMFRKFVKGDFEAFLRECGTYELHRSLFLGYYEDGICKREEGVLLNEVEYEQRRMTEAIVAMLKNSRNTGRL